MRRKKTASKPPAKRKVTKAKTKRVTGPTEEQLRGYVRDEGARFLKDPNITSVGVGLKTVAGKKTKQYAVQFTVGKKVPETQLESLRTEVIPKSVRVGNFEVPTDVLQRSFRPSYKLLQLAAKDPRKQRLATVVPGVSVSHPTGTAGTLGAIVYDQRDGAVCMLSNWHVLHTPEGQIGDEVVQPGPYDDDRVTENRAGTLVRSHLGVAGDCAIARIEGRGVDAVVYDLGVGITKIARPSLGDRVIKSGRTTSVTYGIVTRVDVQSRIDYGGSVGEQQIGGFEIGPDPKHPATDNEVSKGGDSGSAWLVVKPNGKPSDIMVGLHFAGEGEEEADEHALACYAHSVFQKLEIDLAPPSAKESIAEALSSGFNESFLSTRVPLPKLTGNSIADAFKLGGSPRIPYTHFTVILSKSRRMARAVAWNIDGARIRRYGRKGLDFDFDSRVSEEFQVGNDAYSDNKLDRGHIARRADLVWGDTAEAKRANSDSFYFTNITPQHQAFNQSMRAGLWGRLEDAIFDDAQVHDLRLSVLGGPIFKSKDRKYRGIRVPSDFWKLIAFLDDGDQTFKAKAYVLTQDNLLDDIEALDLDEFRLYQVAMTELERLTELDFGALKTDDDFRTGRVPESLSLTGRKRPVREVHSRSDIVA